MRPQKKTDKQGNKEKDETKREGKREGQEILFRQNVVCLTQKQTLAWLSLSLVGSLSLARARRLNILDKRERKKREDNKRRKTKRHRGRVAMRETSRPMGNICEMRKLAREKKGKRGLATRMGECGTEGVGFRWMGVA